MSDPLRNPEVALIIQQPEVWRDLKLYPPTPLQLETWRLESMGMSKRAIALAQGVSPATVRGCLASIHLKMWRAGVRRRDNGTWFIKRKDENGASV